MEEGLIRTTNSFSLHGQLDVGGSATIAESLTIGSGFALSPSGMTVDVESHSGTLFELRSRNEGFNGSLLEIHATTSSGDYDGAADRVGGECAMIKAVVDGMTTFELTSGGDLTLQGVRLNSGGVHVEAGGIQVHSTEHVLLLSL